MHCMGDETKGTCVTRRMLVSSGGMGARGIAVGGTVSQVGTTVVYLS
jgi:hypothetical protein